MIQISIPLDPETAKKLSDYERQWEKGNSLLYFPSDYTVVDLETTGFEPYCDEIIEVACIKYINNEEVERFNSLVQPEPYEDDAGNLRYIDDFIIEHTGITNEMLTSAPKFSAIAERVYNFLRDEILVGHNVNFDINFLLERFHWDYNLPLKNDFADTLRLSRKLLPDLPRHRLCDLMDYFGLTGALHRSVSDCLITQQVYLKLKDLAVSQGIDITKKTALKTKSFDLRTLQCEGHEPDSSSFFYNKNCVFTGVLEKYPRKEAAQIVVNLGGHCENGVTKNTNFLIIGGLNSPLIKGGKSSKMIKAEKLRKAGQDIQIISENTFYEILENE